MPAKNRKPGPSAAAHRVHRHLHGPRMIAPLPSLVPQFLTGPRRGQQLALIRRAASPPGIRGLTAA